MTLLETPPAPPAPPGAVARRRHPLRALAVLVAVLLVAAGGALAVVHALDAAALARVRAFLDARPITCADPSDETTVTRGDDLADETYRVPAVKGALGLDCTLSVVVDNGSDRDVDLRAFDLPYFGPRSGMGVRSDRALTQQSQPEVVDDGLDVVYTWGAEPLIALGAGDSFVYRFHLTSNGCRQAGSTFTSDAPIAVVATGTATRSVPLEGPGFGVLGVRTAAQPCP